MRSLHSIKYTLKNVGQNVTQLLPNVGLVYHHTNIWAMCAQQMGKYVYPTPWQSLPFFEAILICPFVGQYLLHNCWLNYLLNHVGKISPDVGVVVYGPNCWVNVGHMDSSKSWRHKIQKSNCLNFNLFIDNILSQKLCHVI